MVVGEEGVSGSGRRWDNSTFNPALPHDSPYTGLD